MVSFIDQINKEFDSLGIIRSERSTFLSMIIAVFMIFSVAAIDAHVLYSMWYGKVIFWGLIAATIGMVLSRVSDYIQFRHLKLDNKIAFFWVYLGVIEKDFISTFAKDGSILFRGVSAIIGYLNSDPLLKKFLLQHYEPLSEIDFRTLIVKDQETAIKYHGIFSDMAHKTDLRDNLIVEARKQ